jgi:hypothetical protein
MGNLDVMTTLLIKLFGIDPLSVPAPILLLGFTLTAVWTTVLVWAVWTILRVVFNSAADVMEVGHRKQRIVIARGLTRHDYDQVRKGVRSWRLLLIRHGSDDYLRTMAGEADRQAGRTRFDVVNMKLALTPIGEVTLSWKLPVHRRLGTQFRCYIDVREGGAGGEVLTGMLSHYDEIQVLPVDVPNPTRVYFLLKRFRVVTSVDGMKQNIALPE